MKKIIILTLFLISFSALTGQDNNKPIPAFDFLSSYDNVRDFTISSDGKEAYFSIQSPLEQMAVIATIKKENGTWSKIKLAAFSGEYRDIEPFLSTDGLRLYFASNRPLVAASNTAKDYDIWYVERKSKTKAWSAAINLGAPVNSEFNEFYPSLTENNTIYFTRDTPNNSKGKDDIYMSQWKENQYSTPLSLSDSINTAGYEFNAFIAADESYIIFSGYRRKDGLGSGDLYISYQNEDKTWQKASNLGNIINSPFMDYCPFVDTKTHTLYFTSKRNSLVTQKFTSIEAFLTEVDRYENGKSRLYKVMFKF